MVLSFCLGQIGKNGGCITKGGLGCQTERRIDRHAGGRVIVTGFCRCYVYRQGCHDDKNFKGYHPEVLHLVGYLPSEFQLNLIPRLCICICI